ncbi:MAG: beta-3-deoxy-D-manno-oct-2-ulosonic acid transferase, partial [Rhodobacteraceae bacterium]
MDAAGQKARPRLFTYSLSFFFDRDLRAKLAAFGWYPRFGLPLRGHDVVGVWGRGGATKRGQFIARIFGKTLVTFEDAFLRSVKTGREGEQAVGLIWDARGIYFETKKTSDLSDLIDKSANLSAGDLDQASLQLDSFRTANVSKYNATGALPADLPARFILVIDQTANDASIAGGAANGQTFQLMLAAAKSENPDLPIVIKTHPETQAGTRAGYFSAVDCDAQTQLLSQAVSPWDLFGRADKIYCVTSQMGYEAVLAGHKPVVFGAPFYAGFGLTEDRCAAQLPRGSRSKEQLFWATHLQYCQWYDTVQDQPTDLAGASRLLQAKRRHFEMTRKPSHCVGIRLWKRGFLSKYLSAYGTAPQFHPDGKTALKAAQKSNGQVIAWAGGVDDALITACARAQVPLIRIEDGFLRSVGLGANLVVPASLAFDDVGIYYDPKKPSGLEDCITASASLDEAALMRAANLRQRMVSLGLSKYNLVSQTTLLADTDKEIILVPGQVEDDASIKRGTCVVGSNFELLKVTRHDYPDAYIIYKPHPDVEAGLRVGQIKARGLADLVVENADIADLLAQVDRVATM